MSTTETRGVSDVKHSDIDQHSPPAPMSVSLTLIQSHVTLAVCPVSSSSTSEPPSVG
jgi:hypothetical protein